MDYLVSYVIEYDNGNITFDNEVIFSEKGFDRVDVLAIQHKIKEEFKAEKVRILGISSLIRDY